MDFTSDLGIPEFSKILRPYIGDGITTNTKYAEAFFRTFRRDPLDTDVSEDNIEKLTPKPTTLVRYIKGTNSTYGPSKQFAVAMLQVLDKVKSAETIDNYYDDQKESIYNQLKKYYPALDKDKIGETCTEIFEELMERYKDGFYQKKKDENLPSVIPANLTEEALKKIPLDQFELLKEENFKCPLCNRNLYVVKNNIPYFDYEIVQIFPEGLSKETKAVFEKRIPVPSKYNDSSNLIPLCSTDALTYQHIIDVEQAVKLHEKKKYHAYVNTVNKQYDELKLSEQLETIIKKLYTSEITKKPNMDLLMNPVEIRRKIGNDVCYESLIGIIAFNNSQYYYSIKDIFSQMDETNEVSSDEISETIKFCYKKYKRKGLKKDEIFFGIVDWILKNYLLTPTYQITAGILVSYFVQNCEVFEPNEISK